MSNQRGVSSVPTNIITGFLGVGKTTVILNLLNQKPVHERWAVLVNEFGKIGIDGSLLQGHYNEENQVFIREVPGGCMCCAAGLPMQIALNQLLARAKPDRLLIEPTGLGHPREVLDALTADHYQGVLEIQKCVVLVDARKVSDPRYAEHDTFNQQIDVADKVIGHKADLYGDEDKENLMRYVAKRKGLDAAVCFTQGGDIDISMLDGLSVTAQKLKDSNRDNHRHHHEPSTDLDEPRIPEAGYLMIENPGEGYQSIGWRFSPEKVFDRKLLFAWLTGLNVERAKGVFITIDGVFAYNVADDVVTELEIDDCLESRVEIIAPKQCRLEEKALLLCLAATE